MLGQENDDRIPALVKQLRANRNIDIQLKIAADLAAIGPKAGPVLVELLSDPEPSVRRAACYALERIGESASPAVPKLAEALKDPDSDVRAQAALALGSIGVRAKVAIPALVESTKDEDYETRISASTALAKISTSVYDSRDIESLDSLKAAHDQLLSSPDSEVRQQGEVIKRTINYLDLLASQQRQIEPSWWGKIQQVIEKYPLISWIVIVYSLLIAFLMLLLIYRPIWLLKINEKLSSVSINLPAPFLDINSADLLKYITLVGFFHFHPRVLNAWVSNYINQVRISFEARVAVAERSIYVPMPVNLDAQNIPELKAEYLRPIFSKKVACLLIQGEGGSGKTSLACQIAKWSMSRHTEQRINWEHFMLPVLIEQSIDLNNESETDIVKVIQNQIRILIDESEPPSRRLVRELLKQQRILTIFDGFSDMNSLSRRAVLRGIVEIPLNATVITSRTSEQLGGLPKSTIITRRISASSLSAFMHTYLVNRNKRELFTDVEFFEACRHLLLITGDREITPLLAKLYAEQMITIKEGHVDEELPRNIPELMLSFFYSLGHGASPDQLRRLDARRAAQILAWECLRATFRPQAISRQAAVTALNPINPIGDSIDLIDYLQNSLQVVRSAGVDDERIVFTHDSLAEYLGSLYIVEKLDGNEESWRELLQHADEQEGAPDTIKGFLLALRDCCLYKGSEVNTPDFVIDELARRAGLNPEERKRSYLERRLNRLVEQLRLAAADDRAKAAYALGRMGAEAEPSLPALIEALKDESLSVRRAVAEALHSIDPRTNVAAETLAEVEIANEQMLELMDLPSSPFERPGVRLAHCFKRATSISGDFYGLIPRTDGSIGVYLVDVEGHGLSASQQAQAVKQILSRPNIEWGNGRARKQLEIADKLINEELGARNIAVTMNFTEIDPQRMKVRHANAGMPFPLLFRHGQAQPEMLQAAGVYVGGGYSRYSVRPEEIEVSVGDGDILVLYSDGIIEAKDDRGRLFGQRGMIAAIARAGNDRPEVIADEILRAASNHTGRSNPEDDQTLLIIQIGSPIEGTRVAAIKTLEILEGSSDSLEFSLMNAGDTGFAAHENLRKEIKGWAQSYGYSEGRARQVWVATWEAIQNAIKHGSSRGDVIHIRLHTATKDNNLIVELIQPKLWRNWDSELGEIKRDKIQKSQELILGGTVIMLKLANNILVSNQGRRLSMSFSHEAPAFG